MIPKRIWATSVASAATCVLLASCGTGYGTHDASSSSSASVPTAPKQAACGHEFLKDLSKRDRLAQLLMVGITDSTDATAVVRDQHVGGIFLGSWTDDSVFSTERIDHIQDASDTPVMVAIDEEGGRVTRLSERFGPMPSARRSAATMEPKEVRAMARKRGRQLADIGVTVDFAPDVDVSDQADDGSIGDRSYSNNPQKVAAYATAFARGLRDAGVLPVIKHFPGHGHASGDSHSGLVQTPPLPELLKSDLVPYQEMIGSMPLGVMVGHLDVPDLTPEGVPASLSSDAVSLLRSGPNGQWSDFNGVVFTDDLSGMKAITDKYSIPESAEKALGAGSDVALWLTTDEVPDVLDNLESKLEAGDLDADEINMSVLRIARAKGLIHCDPVR